MTRDDAAELAALMAKTWPRGPHPDVWVEVLEPLDYQRARVAYESLRATDEHAPSIPRFRGTASAPTVEPAHLPVVPFLSDEQREAAQRAKDAVMRDLPWKRREREAMSSPTRERTDT